MSTRRCNGKMRKPKGQQLATCSRCGQADWSAKDGDKCTCDVQANEEPEQEKPRGWTPRRKPR